MDLTARARIAVSVGVAGALATGAVAAVAQDRERAATHFKAALSGYQEVPAVSTEATGRFTARITGAGYLRYTLRYADVEGGNVQQAHIHFAQRSVNGGVSAFLCSNLPNPPAGTPACPRTSGTVRGTIEPQDVVGPNGQGIAPGQLEELVRAMRAGITYANVHSDTYPGGELRGQIRPRR